MIQWKPSIRTLMVMIFIIPILLAGIALLLISNYYSQQIENQLGESLIRSNSQHIREHLETCLIEAQKASELYALRLAGGQLPPIPDQQWQDRIYESIQIRPKISAITYATSTGKAIYVMRLEGKYILGLSDGPENFRTHELAYQPDNSLIPVRDYTYDVVNRPWYKLAMQSKSPVWTGVYQWFSSSSSIEFYKKAIPGIGYVRQIHQGGVDGVICVDITFSTLAEQLMKSDVTKIGTCFIVDDTNRVILRSSSKTSMEDLGFQPINAFSDIDAKAAAESLASHNESAYAFHSDQHYRTVYVESISPSQFLHWRLITVLPDSNLSGQIEPMQRNAILFSTLALIIALIFGIRMTLWLSEPIQQLVKHLHTIGNGEFDQSIDLKSTHEFGQLSDAVNDMTRKLKDQVALRAEKEAIQKASETKSAFFHRVTHELRTPLNAIQGYSEILQESPAIMNDPVSREDLGKLQQASRHLLGVINDILDLARIDSGGMTANIGLIEMKPFLRDIEIITRPLVEKNGNSYVIQCDDDIIIRSDKQKLGQILINLINNASKFTSNGNVLVSVLKDKAYVHIRITDTGRGIPPDKIKQIFEPFTRISSSVPGSGLGLAIVKQFTNLLGGEIELSSEIGKGTCADLYLPNDPAVVLQDGQRQVVPRNKHDASR